VCGPGGEGVMRRVLVGLGLLVGLGVVGCGADDEGKGVASARGASGAASASASVSPSVTRAVKPEDARLEFARCMRRNGVDVPDPGSGDDPKMTRLGGPGVNKERLSAALRECQGLLQAGGVLPDMKDPKVRDKYARFAQCMRENGVDMPDPDPDGRLKVPYRGVDRSRIEKARDACKALLPGTGR
jgi:hypothetical protein